MYLLSDALAQLKGQTMKKHTYPTLQEVKQGFANTTPAQVKAHNAAFISVTSKLPRVVVDMTAGMAQAISSSNDYYYACAAARS